jgi:hypothetical protein
LAKIPKSPLKTRRNEGKREKTPFGIQTFSRAFFPTPKKCEVKKKYSPLRIVNLNRIFLFSTTERGELPEYFSR